MATGAAAQAAAQAERRLIDGALRTINDHPRKKRRRAQENKDGLRLNEEENVWRPPERPSVIQPDSFVLRLLAHWIRDPLCRRVASSELRLPSTRFLDLLSSSSSSSSESPSTPSLLSSWPKIEKRFPRVEDKDFVNFETLKSFVAESTPTTTKSRVDLDDGDSIELVHKSIGAAIEVRKKSRERSKSLDSSEAATSFDTLPESFDYNLRDEDIYPPPRPALGPINLIMPLIPTTSTTAPRQREEETIQCRGCPEDNSFCVSCGKTEDESKGSCCEWRSEATSQMELSFRTESVLEDRKSLSKDVEKAADDATKWMVETFKRRLEDRKRRASLSSSSSSSSASSSPLSSSTCDESVGLKKRNPYCAVPLDVFFAEQRQQSRDGRRDSLSFEESVLKLAYVEDIMASKKRGDSMTMGGIFGSTSSESVAGNPFLCGGKIVRLSLDDDDGEKMGTGFGGGGSTSSSADFLVTPRFDLTLEEYLQQMNESSVDGRLLLFLQSLEAVAGLHRHGLSHGSLKANNFFLDLHKDGNHRLLLSDFSKAEALTEDARKSDSWHLGRLGLRLFESDVDDAEMRDCFDTSADLDSSVDDLPVLGADAPLEMDILVHLLMSNDPATRITPSIAANMLHLYFWRNEFRSILPESSAILSSASSSSNSSSSATFLPGFSSANFEAAKTSLAPDSASKSSLKESERDSNRTEGDVKGDLKRCLFHRANFEDVLHADEMWQKSKMDLNKFAVTKDDAHLSLFVDRR